MEMVQLVEEDDDLADAELWAAIDSAAAISTRFPPKPLLLTHYPEPLKSSTLKELPPSPQPNSSSFKSELTRTPKANQIQSHRFHVPDSRQAFSEPKRRAFSRPVSRVYDQNKENCQWMDVAENVGMNRGEMCENRGRQLSYSGRHPPKDVASRESAMLIPVEFRERFSEINSLSERKNKASEGNSSLSSWMCSLPSPSIFKQMQEAAMEVLEKSDYIVMHGKPFIKKSGWRKIAFFFNISFEIKDRQIEFDQNANVLRAEFIVRASMQGGRFSDGWGSCDSREKKYSKPNHDIPSTAETRAKTRACQDLVGIGEYKVGCSDRGW